jgi:LysR family transcriptional activator of nhaA
LDWLNYHHLRYFWTVAKQGSVGQAAKSLHLSHPTVCAQIKELETSLGEKLFRREGRKLALTDAGRTLYTYADQIFTLGQEMLSALRQRPSAGPAKLSVGITHSVPRMVAAGIVQPVLDLTPRVHLSVHVGTITELLGRLDRLEIDLILTDSPATHIDNSPRKVYNHKLGETTITFFASPKLASQLSPGMPQTLNGFPMLLPTVSLKMRRTLDDWFRQHHITPTIIGEFESFPIMNRFAQLGYGAFPSYNIASEAIAETYGVLPVGTAEGVMESFYAVTAERKLEHPAVLAIVAAAQKNFESTMRPVLAGTGRR